MCIRDRVSITGGVFHNIGQILVAMAVVENLKLIYYLPVLLVAGTVTGFVIGIVAGKILPVVKKEAVRTDVYKRQILNRMV